MPSNKLKKYTFALMVSVLMSQIQGCARDPTPLLDTHFGNAVRAARESQRLYPEHPSTSDVPPGLDGKAAVNAIERYQDSFKTPPPTFEVINVGGAASGQ